ncbi:Retrovirus-related Pol polyprotein from transposon, partial [Smittium culicis]
MDMRDQGIVKKSESPGDQSPQDVKAVRNFLGFVGYYRKLVRNFARIARTLTKLTRKDQQYNWTPEFQDSFERLKVAIKEAPILVYPQWDLSSQSLLMPHLWASADLGARERRWKKDHPICKQNITPSRKELFYYRPRRTSSLMGITDHSALVQLYTKDTPHGRVGRWALKLRNYDFEIIHKDGSMNPADFLSRYPAEIDESE